VNTVAYRVWTDEGILCIQSKGIVATRAMVDEVVEITRGLGGGVPIPVLFDFRDWPEKGAVAWDALISNAVYMFSAVGLLVDADRSPRMGAYPETISRLLVPVGVFTDEAEARAFLSTVVPSPDQEPPG
jgi:hypothetical protein